MANLKHLSLIRQGVGPWNQWRESNHERPDLSNGGFRSSDLSGANLSETNLNGAYLSRANLRDANLYGASLSGADLQDAHLGKTNLQGANLSHARLTDAYLSNADLGSANLSRANASGAMLRWAVLNRATSYKTEFNGAILHEANLIGTDLREADLSEADLSGADLREANLQGANLSGANLREANLTGAYLQGTEFGNAIVSWTIMGNVDLSQAIGLKNVRHQGPSTIGLDTIYKSKGIISGKFLKEAGVPEQFLTYMKSLLGEPIEYYSAFISCAHSDSAFAERLFADLKNNDVRTWYAPENLRIGDKILSSIDESIRLYDKLLLVLSRNSVASDWVEHEVETALDKELEQKKIVLFPVQVDNTVMHIDTGWPAYVRKTRHIGDFRQWKDHDAYQIAFQRLLRDLKDRPEDSDYSS